MKKKKFIIIILIVFAIIALLLILKPLLFPEETKFTRNFPTKIKSAFVLPLMRIPGPNAPEKKASLAESLLIKERLAANTYSTQIHYHYQNGKFDLGVTGPKGTPIVPDALVWKDVKDQLKAAKNSGFAVNLMITWGYQGHVELKDKKDLLNFLKAFEEALVEVAKVAEEYQVEYLSLYEPDHMIRDQKFTIPESEMVEIINQYKEETLAKVRAVYNGQLYYQIGDPQAWDFRQLDVSGLDFFGVLIGGSPNFEDFKKKIDLVFSRAGELSTNSGVPWIISELWIGKEYKGVGVNRIPYFEYVFEKSKTSKNLKGIVVDTWNVDEAGFETAVKDTRAEEAVKNFFASWK